MKLKFELPRIPRNLNIPRLYYFYAGVSLLPFILFYMPGLGEQMHLDPVTVGGLDKLPWMALPLLGYLGYKLNQTRIVFCAAALLGVFVLLKMPQTDRALGMGGLDLAYALGLALPLGLALSFTLREDRLFSSSSLVRLCCLCLPLALLSGLSSQEPKAFHDLMAWKFFNDGFFSLPQAALLSFLSLAIFTGISRDRKLKDFLWALLFSMPPIFLATESALTKRLPNPVYHEDIVDLAYMCACGILLHAIFQTYWRRVYVDELTSVPNRRALDERLERLRPPYALAMVDIDHFKKFNDTYGHEEGDNVLKLVAAHLSQESEGKAYRYGGEEFCLVFEGRMPEEAAAVADKIRGSLADREFSIRLPDSIRHKTSSKDRGTLKGHAETVKIHVSMGVAGPDKERREPSDVIRLADQGLYKAKEGGRNCVIKMN